MNLSRKQLAQQAIAQAMKTRKEAGFALHSIINIFDFAEKMGVSVRFCDIPSMEGVYQADAQPKPTIIVSSLRPTGRKAMTCGHELGHHVFGHGTQWDELIDNRLQSQRFEPDEFLVDVFSASLQMPKLAVSHEISKRSLDPNSCRPEEIYALSTLFGVSYGGFVTHLESTLGLINRSRGSDLAKCQPKHLRESLLGRSCPKNLIVVDTDWKDKSADIEVGDSVLLPADVKLEGTFAQIMEQNSKRTIVTAIAPGICKVSTPGGWASFVRITRKDYVGRAPYRFDEETDDEN
ncbi:ImmA/IrrE family metallo-endopeptidase [uncultured Rubinisphaera sp.]|uniref:ImmA/IrrE family metallo-endopeptidase n=1 Tax=uncultured Rubinisphaera sp. TaxID=1678686 RepID=UPI0030DC01C7